MLFKCAVSNEKNHYLTIQGPDGVLEEQNFCRNYIRSRLVGYDGGGGGEKGSLRRNVFKSFLTALIANRFQSS